MDDLISRQSAIDAVKKLVEWYKEKWNESRPTSESVMDVLNDLPSAQPGIIRCRDCKYADDDGVCQNSVGLVIQDDDDFCSKAERWEE